MYVVMCKDNCIQNLVKTVYNKLASMLIPFWSAFAPKSMHTNHTHGKLCGNAEDIDYKRNSFQFTYQYIYI